MPSTSPKIIALVVATIALDATFGVCVLAYCLIRGITPDQVLLTSFIGLTTGLVGTLTGLLINTRSGKDEPAKTEIVNSKLNPVKTEDVKS